MLIPPEQFRKEIGIPSGPGRWYEICVESFLNIRNNFDLKPTDDVLDIGCGVGKLAIPMMIFLQGGSYTGLDACKKYIDWCNENLGNRVLNFVWADVMNTEYSSLGSISDFEYRFPFENETFSFVTSTSLYTHMVLSGFKNYMNETYRVLKPNGLCEFSCFILTDESVSNILTTDPILTFEHTLDSGCRVVSLEIPDRAVAYPLELIERTVSEAGFELVTINYGDWSMSKVTAFRQDEVLVQKV